MLVAIRSQLTNFWQQQKKSQRITLIALIVAALVLIPLFIMWATAPTYAVAFSGLSESDAGQITQQLDTAKIVYKLQDSSTILVNTADVYKVRLMIASAGLPKDSTVGFELFSGSTLGMTDFTEKVNYQRALEGELERTIGSLDSIQSVKVLVVTPEQSLFTGDQAPTTASVTIKVKPGQTLNNTQVSAITHLVASSVQSLKPENVVIVDTDGNLLADGSSDSSQTGAGGQVDTQHGMELAAAQGLQKKIQTMLDSVLGPNKAVVQANVSMDWSQSDTTSQVYDPTAVAVVSSQKTNETYTTDSGTVGGVPGAASNLPTPVATLSATGQPLVYQNSNETTNYEVSQTQTHVVAPPGQIKQVSISVLVDNITDTQQINSIKSAVAAAAGIDTTRGDTLAVESIAFDRTYYTQQQTDLTASKNTDLYFKIGEISAIGLLLLALVWYIFRLFKNLRLAAGESWIPVMQPLGEAALAAGQSPSMITAGEIPSAMEERPLSAPGIPLPGPEFASKVAAATQEDEQMQKVMAQLTDENPATVADIIQLWLNEDEKHHA